MFTNTYFLNDCHFNKGEMVSQWGFGLGIPDWQNLAMQLWQICKSLYPWLGWKSLGSFLSPLSAEITDMHHHARLSWHLFFKCLLSVLVYSFILVVYLYYLNLFIYLYVHKCAHVHIHFPTHVHAMLCLWRSDNTLRESILSFYHVGPWGWTLVIRLGCNTFTH